MFTEWFIERVVFTILDPSRTESICLSEFLETKDNFLDEIIQGRFSGAEKARGAEKRL